MEYRYREVNNLVPLILLAAIIPVVGIYFWFFLVSPTFFQLLVILVLVGIPLLFFKMVVTVDDKEIRIVFGYAGIIKKVIPLSEIVSNEVVNFSPFKDFGGWGLRSGRFKGELTGCLTMKGDRGVFLILKNPIGFCFAKANRVIIGAQDAQKLSAALLGK